MISCLYGEFEGYWDFFVEFICLCFIIERVFGLVVFLLLSVMLLFKLISFWFWSIEGFEGDWELLIVDLVVVGDLIWLIEVIGIFLKYEVEFKLISFWWWSLCVFFFVVVVCVFRGDIFVEGNIIFDFLGKFFKLWFKEIKLFFLCFLIEG